MVIDTTSEFHAGYIAATIIYLAYMFSIWSRARKARERLERRTTAPPPG